MQWRFLRKISLAVSEVATIHVMMRWRKDNELWALCFEQYLEIRHLYHNNLVYPKLLLLTLMLPLIDFIIYFYNALNNFQQVTNFVILTINKSFNFHRILIAYYFRLQGNQLKAIYNTTIYLGNREKLLSWQFRNPLVLSGSRVFFDIKQFCLFTALDRHLIGGRNISDFSSATSLYNMNFK